MQPPNTGRLRLRLLFQLSIKGAKHGRCGADCDGIRDRFCQVHACDRIRSEVRQQENQRDEQDNFPPDGEKDRFVNFGLSHC